MFRKATPDAIELISALLEYTPTQRLSAIEAMCQPFFDELRDPNTRLPDSRHSNSASKELPNLFDFSRHGMLDFFLRPFSLLTLFRTFDRPISQPQTSPSTRAPGTGCWRS